MSSVQRGFTLFELLTVTALIAIVLALSSLSFRGTEARQLREEGERLAALIRLAGDESALDGRTLALTFSERGYAFSRRGLDGSWVQIVDDEVFRPRTLGGDVKVLSLSLDGKRLLFSPSGEAPVFAVTLGREGSAVTVSGEADGSLSVSSRDA
jgi:general secretion pathway protein H